MHLASISDNLWNIDFGTKSLIASILRHLLQLYWDYPAPYVMDVSNFHATPLTPSFSMKMQIRIGSWVSLFCWGDEWSFEWDHKNRSPVPKQLWHDKDPSLPKGQVHQTKTQFFCSQPPIMVKSPNYRNCPQAEWNNNRTKNAITTRLWSIYG